MDRWWANCVRNDEERKWIGDTIKKVRMDNGYVFTRGMYKAALDRRKRTGSLWDSDEVAQMVKTV